MKKLCARCKEEKDLTEFHKNKQGRFCRSAYCKECSKELASMPKNRLVRNRRIRKRYSEDPVFRLKKKVRSLITSSFKRVGLLKESKTKAILGCDFPFLHSHLYITFFNRYGRHVESTDVLHIDHIVPLATANTKEDIVKLCHYSNLQWLLAKDNSDKGRKLDWENKKDK